MEDNHSLAAIISARGVFQANVPDLGPRLVLLTDLLHAQHLVVRIGNLLLFLHLVGVRMVASLDNLSDGFFVFIQSFSDFTTCCCVFSRSH